MRLSKEAIAQLKKENYDNLKYWLNYLETAQTNTEKAICNNHLTIENEITLLITELEKETLPISLEKEQ